MKRKIKINFKDKGYKDGDIISIDCNDGGVPKDIFWRRRFKEAERNNCVEWVDTKVPKSGTSGKSSKSKSSKEE